MILPNKPITLSCFNSCNNLISRNAVLFIPSLASARLPTLIY